MLITTKSHLPYKFQVHLFSQACVSGNPISLPPRTSSLTSYLLLPCCAHSPIQWQLSIPNPSTLPSTLREILQKLPSLPSAHPIAFSSLVLSAFVLERAFHLFFCLLWEKAFSLLISFNTACGCPYNSCGCHSHQHIETELN